MAQGRNAYTEPSQSRLSAATGTLQPAYESAGEWSYVAYAGSMDNAVGSNSTCPGWHFWRRHNPRSRAVRRTESKRAADTANHSQRGSRWSDHDTAGHEFQSSRTYWPHT